MPKRVGIAGTSKGPPLRSFRVQNFKAIRDSDEITFGRLTAFIGNNGVGKSSLVEALETFRDVVVSGVDSGFQKWRGFEHALNKAPSRTLEFLPPRRPGLSHPMEFMLHWQRGGRSLQLSQAITQGPKGQSLFIEREEITQRRAARNERWTRDARGNVDFIGDRGPDTKMEAFELTDFADGESILKRFAPETFDRMQFLMLAPERMGHPVLQQRATKDVRLSRDGSNIAQYLSAIRKLDPAAFDGLLDAIRYVLPYARELEPALTSELEKSYYLKLTEGRFEVPGWLLSTGTLRIAAILACLRHPSPPAVLVIEEIENGLDPRTIQLVVSELKSATLSAGTQVIVTTHSPYLLDLLDISHIVIVERAKGQPVFHRPDEKELALWSKKYSPGRLYTMGKFNKWSK